NKKGLGEITPDQRAAINLFWYHDLSYKEMCKVLKINMGTLKSRLHRGHMALKEKLAPYMEESCHETHQEVNINEL
ncbi:MAG: hypothetical protein J7M18_08360, partial [Candidatus Eremiobacteraeota bacterium]|nr:hypothetical protein [Candidatus Eremiobacteraeota bacterium]